MLEVLDSGVSNFVCFKASGVLTEDDYTGVFEPAMKAVIDAHAGFRLYADLSELEEMDEASQWESGVILAANRDKCEKAAVIGGPSWAGLALMLRDSLPEGAHEFFVEGRQLDAMDWLKT